MKIKKNSKAYKIAEFGGLIQLRDEGSLCEFNTHFIIGFVMGTLITVLTILCLIAMATPFYYGLLHLINPLNEFPVVDSQQYRQFIIGLVLDGLALFMSILCLVINYHSNKEYKAKEWGIDDNESKINEPSNLLLHWRAFKDKVCIKVQYE